MVRTLGYHWNTIRIPWNTMGVPLEYQFACAGAQFGPQRHSWSMLGPSLEAYFRTGPEQSPVYAEKLVA